MSDISENDLNKENINEKVEEKIGEQEPQKIKHRAFNAIKRIVKNNSLSLLTIAGTAATAVSMSVISSHLTGTINSLILVAVVSIGTALLNEIYRIILSITTLGAKKVIEPVIHLETIPPTKPNATPKPITTTIKTNETPQKEQTPPPKEYTGTNKIKKTFYKIKKYFHERPFMKLVLIFSTFSIITISIFNILSDDNNTDIEYKTIHQTNEETISEETKNEIIQQIITELNNNQTNQENTETIPEETQIIPEETENLKTEIENLKETINNLQNETDELKNNSENNNNETETNQQQNNSNNDNNNTELENRINSLETQISQLETQLNNNTTNNTSNNTQ